MKSFARSLSFIIRFIATRKWAIEPLGFRFFIEPLPPDKALFNFCLGFLYIFGKFPTASSRLGE